MDIQEILSSIEKEIKTPQEREYFLIHEARYGYVLKQINKLTTQQSNKTLRILDVGCYPYHMGKALELMGHEIWGISSTHEPIKNKKVAILNIETDAFPYKDNFFDLVLCSEVIEHLPHSPIPALREMYRVTRPGGHLLITTPNIARSLNRIILFFGHAAAYPINNFLENGGKGSNLYHRHNRELTLRELTTLVAHAKWTIQKARHFVSYTPFRRRNRNDNPLLWLGKFVNFMAMKAIPSLADTLLIIGRKQDPHK